MNLLCRIFGHIKNTKFMYINIGIGCGTVGFKCVRCRFNIIGNSKYKEVGKKSEVKNGR